MSEILKKYLFLQLRKHAGEIREDCSSYEDVCYHLDEIEEIIDVLESENQ